MKAYETIHVQHEGRVAHLQLNRPERINALGKAMLREIQDALDALESDPEVRAIVLSGAGRGFSSGFDLKEQMARRPEGATAWREILELDFATTMRFWDSPKPTIAAIHGPCMAGAFEMALACDLSVCSRDAVFGEPELKFGAGIVTLLLPWMVGPKAAKDILLTGEDGVSAERALALGIVSRVVPEGEHLTAALAVGRPDERLGQRIHALVVPRGPGLVPAELRAFLRGRLEKYKQPDVLYFAAELPAGRTGKADRGRFAAMLERGELAPVEGDLPP